MKKCMRYLWMAAMMVCSLHAVADSQAYHDTVYFYTSWEEMYDMTPMSMVIDPYIEQVSPFELHIFMTQGVESVNLSKEVLKNHVGISIGDSILLVNSQYLKREFDGDVKRLSGCVPVFFNERVAYLVYTGNPSVKDVLFGDDENYTMDYYYIDFQKRTVKKVTHTYLSELLQDYHDLQMRYEGMKDYKKREIIQEFFMRYINRAANDFLRPTIFDIMGS